MDLTKLEARARAVSDLGVNATSSGQLAMEMAGAVLCLLKRLREAEAATSALSRLTAAALPVDLWLGSQRAHPLTESERKEFVDAFSVALISLPGYQAGEDAIT